MSTQFCLTNQPSSLSNNSITKRQYCVKFISSLIQNPKYKPFVQFNDILIIFSDAQFITRQRGLSLFVLRQEILKRKQFIMDWFIKELKKVFIQVSDYILLDDPLQSTCQQALNQIKQFQKEFNSLFSKKKNSKQSVDKIGQIEGEKDKEQKQIGEKKRSRRNKTADFKSQLEMVYYLKNYQNDEEVMRKIGEVCNIISQNQQEYIFELGKNSIWQDMIDKSQE